MSEVAEQQESGLTAVRAQLAEAQETLRAIRDGEVDALVVSGGSPGEQIFTLSTADRPYRLFVETMTDGAATVSASGVILYVNQCLAQMVGWPISRIVGSPVTSLVAERHQSALRAHDGSSDRDANLEVELLGHGRQRVWARVGASTLEVDGERMVCLTFADLTQSRRHQSALASAHQKALAALRTRSQFVANMSHEIRTPLNGVIGMAGLMLTTDLSAEQREYADGVRTSGDALMAVVDQILDFTKLDSGSLEIEDIPFSPLTVLEETCSMVAAAAQAKGVELLSEVEGQLPQLVSGDCTRLRQVLINLMGNAVKFTADGYVCATLSAVSERGGWRLRFTVKDTGVGVEPSATGRIFNSFAQADGSTTRRFGGTGLGLAISRQLVGLMGGEIGVESGKGSGSTFWFTLFTGAVPDMSLPTAQPRLPPARVLLVDDSAMSRRVLERRLAGWGLSCLALAGAERALAVIADQERLGQGFDLVLLDSDMPGVGGIALARAVRSSAVSSEREREVPIALMIRDQRERAAGRLAGIDFFVSKPIRQGRLYDTLSEALQLGGVGRLTREHDQPTRRLAVSVPNGVQPHSDTDPTVSATALPFDLALPAILLVEDNRINQMVAVRMLRKRGYEVDVASDGRVALDMYDRRPYGAILMDCQMPVLDGYQASAEIRRREPENEHLPILAMTANTMKGDREKCLASGMDDYLGKPFTADALDTALIRLLNAQQPGGGDGGTAADRREAGAAWAPILDSSVISDLCGDDDDLRQELLTMFARDLETALGRIEAAAEAVDLPALLAEAHTLKGSSGSVGAQRIGQLSDALCIAARAGAVDGVLSLVNDLRTASSLTLAVLSPESRAETLPALNIVGD